MLLSPENVGGKAQELTGKVVHMGTRITESVIVNNRNKTKGIYEHMQQEKLVTGLVSDT